MGLINQAVAAALGAAGVYAGVSTVMAAGLTRTKRIRPDDTPDSVGMSYEDVVFRPRGGGPELSGWIVPAQGLSVTEATEQSPWLVMVHGFGTNRTDPSVGLLGLARELNTLGYALLMFDTRGCGESGGAAGSVGYYERLDVLGALDLLAYRGVPASRVALVGFSLGAAIALLVGTVPGTCAAVVADSPFPDIRLTIRHTTGGILRPLSLFYPGMQVVARSLFGIDLEELSPARALAASDVPCLVIHGSQDKYVPDDHAAILERALGASPAGARSGDRRLWQSTGSGHVQAFRDRSDEYIELVAGFLAAHMQNGPARN